MRRTTLSASTATGAELSKALPNRRNTTLSRTTLPPIKLLIQPGAGIAPLLQGIEQAQEIIQIVIFRFDRGEIEAALKRAVRRGVFVHALVAHTMAGQGGEKMLRKLEMRLLADGVSVTRTADDLLRYHDKLMIIDRKTLYLLGFNYTYIDIERSRCFGIITSNSVWVEEAEKLFVADTKRQPYTPECDTFLVSPGNTRLQLTALLSSARHQILIYDGKLSDPDVMRLLASKVRAGVEVRVIGSVGKRAFGVQVAQLDIRLHAQAVIVDGARLFLGSQSLRSLELDARREVGVLIDDLDTVHQVVATFEADWANSEKVRKLRQIARGGDAGEALESPRVPVRSDQLPTLSADAVKEAIKEAILDVVLQTLQQNSESVSLKDAVKEAAKEALEELAP
jgi:cardiolipin synthase A/B